MLSISIGVHVHAEPERLNATLASLRSNTGGEFDLLILPDGPDGVTETAVAALGDVRALGTVEPLGSPACFNRLITNSSADVYILLESGARVGPGWLDFLLAALNADERNGLAGPSTNSSWNEQCVFANRGGSPAEIARTAQEAARRFGSARRTLEPLYSLADFCYVVKHSVIDTIGAADEQYGLGPCWEMDYNIRAARAGFRGVWACGAYVYRSPFTARRQREEALRFEASKRRYQDKFCALRLRGEKSDFEPHCKGEACPHFAPINLIEHKRPLPSPVPSVERTPPPSILQVAPSDPLVSCIMPTYNRRAFIGQAIRYFMRQDYPNLELVVVDDGTDHVDDCLPAEPRVRYVRAEKRLTIGAKRNLACSQARGEFIVHWDDDDWYPSWRIRTQINALVANNADVCGSSQLFFYDSAANRAWRYQYFGQGAPWVAGATLAFRKSFWAGNQFPDIQVGEDARFVWGSPPNAVCDMRNPALCIATIHAANTSPKVLSGVYWQPQSMDQLIVLLGEDLKFYCPQAVVPADAPLPLVSCIMPTYNRRQFVPLSLRWFLSQDYPNKELLILDDGSDPVGDIVEGLPNVEYIRLDRRFSIGAKRNLACQRARGEIIAHWDDDDWYAPGRLYYQIGPILAGQADMTGLENAYILHLPDGIFWTTHSHLHRRMFVGNVHGGTIMFRKALLTQGMRYPEINLAEDAYLIQQALRSGRRLERLDNNGTFVYIRHGQNAWQFEAGRFLDPGGWQRTEPPPSFSPEILTSYRAAVGVETAAALQGV